MQENTLRDVSNKTIFKNISLVNDQIWGERCILYTNFQKSLFYILFVVVFFVF